jgi:N-acetylmuramoyl-L-alanine amidase
MPINFGRPINRIVVHCTATSQSATVDGILNYWKNTLGWKNPGYHYIIGINGERNIISNLRLPTNGVRGYNWDSVHISYIGGRYGDDRTIQQKAELENLLLELVHPNLLGILPIVGHRDLSPDKNGDGIITSNEWVKLCPSFDVTKWLNDINFYNKIIK